MTVVHDPQYINYNNMTIAYRYLNNIHDTTVIMVKYVTKKVWKKINTKNYLKNQQKKRLRLYTTIIL